METLFYSTGKAARELGVSQERIRDLCSAGAIPAESTPGGQFRISGDELERFKRDGLPPLARPMPGGAPRSTANPRYGSAALLAAPSGAVIDATEEVAIVEARLQRRRLERDLAETEDWFTERESAEAEREAEQTRLEQNRLASAQAKQERDAWLQRWERYALRALPYDMEPQDELDLSEAVRTRLAGLSPIPDECVTRTLVDAEVQKIVQARKRWRDIEAVLLEARDHWLPSRARSLSEPTGWQIQAVKAAGAAISQLRNDARIEEIRAVAKQAVEKIAAEYEVFWASQEDAEMRQSVIRWSSVPDALTEAGKEAATRAIAEAIGKHPQGTPRGILEQARDEALAPFRAAVAQAQEQARKQAGEARRLSDAEFRVNLRISHVYDYLGRLEKQEDIEFDGFSDRWDTAEKLKEKIRPFMVKELVQKPDMPDAQIQKRIEALVDAQLDSVLAA